jgi:hypothetical protein
MHLTVLDQVLWGVGTALKVLVCVLAFYRRLYRRLPLFTVYLALLLGEAAVLWYAYHQWGFTSLAARYVYWSALGVVLLARGLVVAELCSTTLKGYPGIWSFIWKFLCVAAGLLVGYAGIASMQENSHTIAFLLTAERGLELAAAVILVVLLGIIVRYKIRSDPVVRYIVLGLALYSTFQVMNNTFMSRWMASYFHWWSSTRVASFDITLVIWLIPLLRPLSAAPPPPPQFSEQASVFLLRRVLDRMHEVTEQLKRPRRR